MEDNLRKNMEYNLRRKKYFAPKDELKKKWKQPQTRLIYYYVTAKKF